MFRSIQWRITFWFFLVILISMSILAAYLTSSVRNDQIDSLRLQLENEAKLTAQISLSGLTDQEKLANLDILIKDLSSQIDARITIVALDGTVIADSDENPSMMENHSTRPEIKDALDSGFGESIRYSTTLGREMMYVAVPVTDNGKVLGTARVALPLTQVESSVNQIIAYIVIAMAITAVLVIIASWIIARAMTRPIRKLTLIAQEVAAGRFDHKISVEARDESGRLAHAFNDMSANLKKMVRTISEDKARLVTILDNMADGVIMTDSEGNVIVANKAVERLLNFDTSDITTRPLIEIIRDHELNDILKSCLETGKEQETQFESSTSGRFFRAIAIPVSTDGLGGALILLQDLTELRNLQTMRRELVGNISHELRTPLAGIKAMVETLQDGAVDEKDVAKDFLNKIENEADRLTQLVAELTELSRIETGRAELKTEPVNLNDLLNDVIDQLMPQVERQELSLNKNYLLDLPSVLADKARIRQVILNLIHNAIKFNRPGGTITATTRSDDNSVLLEISDTGYGISRDDLPRIFERFFKADKSRSGQGTGIGLAVAKHIIEAHHGEIWAESQEGSGSVFAFRLPVNIDDIIKD